jgi:ribosomal protein S18 acetylase RimI-like enzyme
MKQTEIIKWTKEDFETVRDILLNTWKDTYSSYIPAIDIINYLNSTYNDEKLLQIFLNELSNAFFIKVDKICAGWMRTNINMEQQRFYISSLYILPKYQGLGLGKMLMSCAEEEAIRNNFDRLWLGVMSQNIKSIDWYKKLGFKFVEEEPFTMGTTTVNHLIGYRLVNPLF